MTIKQFYFKITYVKRIVYNACVLQIAALRVTSRCFIMPLTWMLSRSERHRIWRLYEILFGSERLGNYPEIPLCRLAHRGIDLTLTHIPAESYNVNDYELLALVVLAARLRPSHVFEFGTADGRTTLNLALNCPESACIYTLSLPLEMDTGHSQSVPIGSAFRYTNVEAKITQLWGDSRTYDYSPYVGKCQLIFIDAEHSETGVEADTRSALTMIDRQNGIIVWHDALRFGVQKVLPQVSKSIGPIHLIARTNLAILCFSNGIAINPHVYDIIFN